MFSGPDRFSGLGAIDAGSLPGRIGGPGDDVDADTGPLGSLFTGCSSGGHDLCRLSGSAMCCSGSGRSSDAGPFGSRGITEIMSDLCASKSVTNAPLESI